MTLLLPLNHWFAMAWPSTSEAVRSDCHERRSAQEVENPTVEFSWLLNLQEMSAIVEDHR